MDTERIPRHPDVGALTLQRLLEALVDPVRRSIVEQLYDAPAAVACGGFDLPVGKSTATHHFRVLREAGLIRQYYEGTSRMNALRRAEVEAAFPGVLDAVVSADRAGRAPAL
ncbi:ArsR/SmtB family transcription factor [Nocardiopsis flavescens]|uniref:DNA-binding transcriptional regulator, ArsR family n=1 Tax=Nocardiopsis flavescens TaxID=758803 RepID=A0A1M6ANR7_9ACTN|nr:helix-turn-helix transcriptional regulator [Nocardiopsis flavescens]SHI38126.1 DNA-binding transcriptional regulator, ArsR family [Nocardiopsis flavescens]